MATTIQVRAVVLLDFVVWFDETRVFRISVDWILWGVPLASIPRCSNLHSPQVVCTVGGFLPVAGCGGWVFRYPRFRVVVLGSYIISFCSKRSICGASPCTRLTFFSWKKESKQRKFHRLCAGQSSADSLGHWVQSKCAPSGLRLKWILFNLDLQNSL